MKKLLTSVVALAMTAGLALSMTACGFTGGSGTVGEKLPEETFAESWAAAFDEKNFENFKLTASQTYTIGEGIKQSGGTMELVRAGNGLEYTRLRDEDMDMECYFDGEKFYQRGEDGGSIWHIVTEPNGSTVTEMLDIWVFMYTTRGEEFTYDEDEGGYVLETNLGGVSAAFIFKFKGGKLVHISQSGKTEQGNETRVDISITYGGQSLTLPKVSESAE